MSTALLFLLFCWVAGHEETVQWGTSPARNNVSTATELPEKWSPGQFERRTGKWVGGPKAKNIKWVAPLGSTTYATPIVTGNRVFCGTNNTSALDPAYPGNVDLGVLVVLDGENGKFLGQFVREKLDGAIDWPEQGICSNPAVQGDRLWIVTNRSEIVCLDIRPETPEIVWSFDMIGRLGTRPHNMTSCSPLLLGDLVFSGTSNGVGPDDKTVLFPEAPSFIALDKNDGALVWSDATPGENVLDGQWGSPSALVFAGRDGTERTQVLFPGGDGWLYAFEVRGREITPSWKFDCNPKTSVWKGHGSGDRNTLLASPVVADGRVYIATGQDPESGEGPAVLWCIEPARALLEYENVATAESNPAAEPQGRLSDRFVDLSESLVVDAAGKIVPPKRTRAVDESVGKKVEPNPQSAARWSYRGKNPKSKEFEDTLHRTIGSVVVSGGLLLVGDFCGVVHCLDAATGECFWTYDMMSTVWGSPLAADGRFFLCDSDGDVAIFRQSKELELLEEINMGAGVYGSPVPHGKTLYISTSNHVFAVEVP